MPRSCQQSSNEASILDDPWDTEAKVHDSHLRGENPSPGVRKASGLKNILTYPSPFSPASSLPRFRGNFESSTKIKEMSVMAKPGRQETHSDSLSVVPFPQPASASGSGPLCTGDRAASPVHGQAQT